MFNRLHFVALAICLAGCAYSPSNPTAPPPLGEYSKGTMVQTTDPHKLWGLFQLEFSNDHSSCTVVPVRNADFHINALKFLETTPCTNCLSVGNVKKLGNGVIDLDVTIHHPFPNQLIYSAFDVKGIIIFNGSFMCRFSPLYNTYPEVGSKSSVSWARIGDWELLNPDGYSFYWSPLFNPDSEWPITHYMAGKRSSGTPTGAINGFKNFYTDEDRHLFRAGHSVTSTYRIQTQPGPMTVGYAIDACWEPPINMPVTDPLTDFPPSANQPEPYQFSVIVNDGQPVNSKYVLADFPDNNNGAIKLIVHQWNGQTMTKETSTLDYAPPDQWPASDPDSVVYGSTAEPLIECDPPCGDGCYGGIGFNFDGTVPHGWFRLAVCTYWGSESTMDYHDYAVTMTDFYYNPY
jgi:hypothetical protein